MNVKEKKYIDTLEELIDHYESVINGIILKYGLRPEQPKAEIIKYKLSKLKTELNIKT